MTFGDCFSLLNFFCVGLFLVWWNNSYSLRLRDILIRIWFSKSSFIHRRSSRRYKLILYVYFLECRKEKTAADSLQLVLCSLIRCCVLVGCLFEPQLIIQTNLNSWGGVFYYDFVWFLQVTSNEDSSTNWDDHRHRVQLAIITRDNYFYFKDTTTTKELQQIEGN